MNQEFIIGFVKQAQAKGLKPLHALEILKEAGPLEWLGNKWTNAKDFINTNVNLSNNLVSHFLSAATSSSPEGYFDGFSKRYNQSEQIDNIQNRDAYSLAARHQAAQGNREGVEANLEGAQKYNAFLADPTNDNTKAMEKGISNINWVTNDWNNRQAKIQKDQEASAAIRNPLYNATTKPLNLAEPGKALAPTSLNPTPAPGQGGSGLAGASPMPDLRTSFNVDTNLRKPLGGY